MKHKTKCINIRLNITFTKIIGTCIIVTGIKLNNMTLVGWGCGVLVGRKMASAFINE